MRTTRHWVLCLEVDGATIYWSDATTEITTTTGTIGVRAGLADDLQAALGDVVALSILDPEYDWPALAEHLERSAATVYLWEEGTTLTDEDIVVRGNAYRIRAGTRYEALDLEVRRSDRLELQLQIPDVLARVDEETWASAQIPDDQLGHYYPVVMGYPGYVQGRATPFPVVPVTLARYTGTANTSYYVVGDRALEGVDVAGSASVRVENPQTATGGSEDLIARLDDDLLGRTVTYCLAGATTFPGGASEKKAFYAGYSPDSPYGVGGLYRGAWDVIDWILRTWASDTDIDWGRMRNLEDLNIYQVDDYINAPTKPWDWIDAVLVRHLPVEIRESPRGRYLERVRYTAGAREALGTLDADRGDWERRSKVEGADIQIANEFVADFRRNRNGTWLARRVLTSEDGVIGRTYGTDERVLGNPLCWRSASIYGIRQAAPLEIGWTWDDNTVRRILEDNAADRALPYRTVRGYVPDGGDIRTGDVYLLTDTAAGLTDQVAICMEPPLITRAGATVLWRLPPTLS